MNKIIAILMIINICNAGTWSSSGDDGIREAFNEYNNLVKQKNDKIKKQYETLNKKEIEKILKRFEAKKDFLSAYKALLKQELLDIKNFQAELVRYKLLTDNEAKK